MAEGKPRSWRFVLMPYLWILDKRLEIGTPEYRVASSSNFWGVLGDLRWGGLVAFEAWHAPWGLWLDLQTVRFVTKTMSLGLEVEQDVRQVVAKVMGAHRFGDDDAYLDLYAGARGFYLDSRVDVQLFRSYDDLFRWLDPLVGVRGGWAFADKWHAELAVDAAGFGVGSKLTVEATAQVRYEFKPGRSVALGYRHEDYDYERDGFVYDATIRGPTIGFRFEF